MKIITLNCNDTEIYISLDEFVKYIPTSVIENFNSYRQSNSNFYDNLQANWNTFSPQNELQCFITAINDESDLPYQTFNADSDISRLVFLKYACNNYFPHEYIIIRAEIENSLPHSGMLTRYELKDIPSIDNQIEAKKQFVRNVLDAAKRRYEKTLKSKEVSKNVT